MKPQPSLEKPPVKAPGERAVQDIRRAARKHSSALRPFRVTLIGRKVLNTLNNRICPENCFLPGELETQFGRFIEHYIHQRYYEAPGKVTLAHACFGRDKAILAESHSSRQEPGAILSKRSAREKWVIPGGSPL